MAKTVVDFFIKQRKSLKIKFYMFCDPSMRLQKKSYYKLCIVLIFSKHKS